MTIMKRRCEGCGGDGVRVPADPSCAIDGKPRAWIVVERCDTCEIFADDLAAALSSFRRAGWFRCENGGLHVLAVPRSACSPTSLQKMGSINAKSTTGGIPRSFLPLRNGSTFAAFESKTQSTAFGGFRALLGPRRQTNDFSRLTANL